ncbi:hypothetical protein GA0074704_0855 [Micromonospora siamensis]|uniref:Uncharacterized protein n=1 Tax=Micromonospora siamensis TaxID=299152 RepID=A0A1C5H2L2_9ACTN|nr:hypothetical protein GA0074704_0855 [Micromonospora siamensis]
MTRPNDATGSTAGGVRGAGYHQRQDNSRRRVSYDEYVLAAALTLARRHRPVWSWQHWRRICRCGRDLPCRSRHPIPINRGHWPSQDAPR